MMLTAYPQAAKPGIVRLWVGVWDTEAPSPVTISVNGSPAPAQVVKAMAPIRDGITGPGGGPFNHRAVFEIAGLPSDRPHRVRIDVGVESCELSVQSLPDRIPDILDGTFNVMMCSCYYQPEDASGLLGTIVSQIMLRPHLTLMMGDQVYGDLPLLANLDAKGAARDLAQKYRRNWASERLGSGGLGSVLAAAPTLCIADDHEFWNNYPFEQAQLPPTWTVAGRDAWKRAATELYEDFQLGDARAGDAQRIDVEPLKLLCLDTRSCRDEDFDALMPPSALKALEKWADELVRAQGAARGPWFGVLVSGQALFASPQADSRKRRVDAEMSNYEQFATGVLPQLVRLADESIPVVYLTGDVHWGRVAQAVDVLSGRTLLHEVIASPSRLIRVPLVDKGKEIGNAARGLFGRRDPWPRHSAPDDVPDWLSGGKRMRLQCDPARGIGLQQRGDQVAILSFCRAGGGVNFNASYYGITPDKTMGRSLTTPTYELRVH
jgi:phosphodiesterase/alkaline phosphatase D-like protein